MGSWLAHALALMGVRQIVVVDPDVVEPANLTRQLYTADDVGTRKIEALGASLRGTGPTWPIRGVDLLVTDPADLVALLDGVDVVAGCADQPSSDEAALLVARACVPPARRTRQPSTRARWCASARRGSRGVGRRPATAACSSCATATPRAWSLPTTAEVRPPGRTGPR